MEVGDIIVFVLCLVAAGVFLALGIPCSRGWVRPNPLYGFRTRKTLQDADVWYATNRVAGYWGIVTGMVAAVVSIPTFFPCNFRVVLWLRIKYAHAGFRAPTVRRYGKKGAKNSSCSRRVVRRRRRCRWISSRN